jgi:uncharacterized protein (TIGR02284 family)
MAKNDDISALLSNLVALDFDAIEAYEAAINRLEDETSKRELAVFKGDHERHVRVLSPHVSRLGGKPPTSGDFKRFLTQGKVVIGSIIGDEGILKAMKSNEDTTNQNYEDAVKAAQSGGQSATLIQDLKKNLDDERRHRAWIESRLTALKAAA